MNMASRPLSSQCCNTISGGVSLKSDRVMTGNLLLNCVQFSRPVRGMYVLYSTYCRVACSRSPDEARRSSVVEHAKPQKIQATIAHSFALYHHLCTPYASLILLIPNNNTLLRIMLWSYSLLSFQLYALPAPYTHSSRREFAP